eukprot:1175712-Prorocentrum_minimum.AAC.1
MQKQQREAFAAEQKAFMEELMAQQQALREQAKLMSTMFTVSPEPSPPLFAPPEKKHRKRRTIFYFFIKIKIARSGCSYVGRTCQLADAFSPEPRSPPASRRLPPRRRPPPTKRKAQTCCLIESSPFAPFPVHYRRCR